MVLRPVTPMPIRSNRRGKKADFTHKFIIFCNGRKGRSHESRGRTAFPDRCLYVEMKSPETTLLPLIEKDLKKLDGKTYKIVKYKPEILKLFPHFEMVRCSSPEQLMAQIGKFWDLENA